MTNLKTRLLKLEKQKAKSHEPVIFARRIGFGETRPIPDDIAQNPRAIIVNFKRLPPNLEG